MKNQTPLVSVIIPVYNTEDYVGACIESVLTQDYEPVEIIVVNDGSTDNSGSVIDSYAQSDSRIIPVHKDNEGPALAREAGINKALGKYILYLDSDDILLEGGISYLVCKAEESQAEVVAAPFYFCSSDEPDRQSMELDFEELSGIDYLRKILQGKAYWSVWSHFQRRSLSTDYPIETVPGILFGEDAIYMVQLLAHTRKVVSADKPILHYNRRSTSLCHREDIGESRYRSLRAYPVWIENYVVRNGLTSALEKDLPWLHLRMMFECLERGRFECVYVDMKRANRDLKRFPELEDGLTRRQRKLILAYGICRWWGNRYLRKYYK